MKRLTTDKIFIEKNLLDNNVGFITMDDFLNIVLKYFSRYVYNDIAEVFQQGLVYQIKEKIIDILNENSLIKEINSDTILRTSSGDGP